MSPRVRWVSGALAVVLALSAAWTWWHQRPPQHYLSSPPAEFAALFAPPPAADSAAARAELDELLDIQATRTSAQVAAAQYDRKTEVDRFYSALGLDPERARLLAVGLVGLSQVTARSWLADNRRVPKEDAVALISNLAWRGIGGGFPLQH